ncbi:MAG: PEP-CTERM sorting domain-containing protein [Planctomycetes bacterium]|nr:PEP-CTERM sorting domain-containing protein [Planctomycetota bacterium]
MQRLWGVVVVLALASPVMAGPTLQITGDMWDGNSMYFDLVIVDNGGTGETCKGFGATAVLSGADASRFVTQPQRVNNLTGASMGNLVAPATYAWAGFFMPVTATNYSATDMAFGQQGALVVDYVALNSLAAGTVVARFYFELQDPGTPVTDVRVSIMSYAKTESYPVFTNAAGQAIAGTVLNNGANIIPEPATMGLLVLGLAGMVVRRRNGR